MQHGTFELMTAFPDLPHLLFEPVEEFFPRIATGYAKIKHELIKVAVSDQTAPSR